jgi:hypothetical protein
MKKRRLEDLLETAHKREEKSTLARAYDRWRIPTPVQYFVDLSEIKRIIERAVARLVTYDVYLFGGPFPNFVGYLKRRMSKQENPE